jgi:hypothetical protein
MMQQQGDVLLKPIIGIPRGATKATPKRNRWVLAEGEVTGHCHAIEQIDGCVVYEKDGTLYLSVEAPVELTHEEHHAQTIAPGKYEIGIVQEYDYLNAMTRTVMD